MYISLKGDIMQQKPNSPEFGIVSFHDGLWTEKEETNKNIRVNKETNTEPILVSAKCLTVLLNKCRWQVFV